MKALKPGQRQGKVKQKQCCGGKQSRPVGCTVCLCVGNFPAGVGGHNLRLTDRAPSHTHTLRTEVRQTRERLKELVPINKWAYVQIPKAISAAGGHLMLLSAPCAGARGGAVGSGTELQAVKSRFRFPNFSLT